MAMNVFLQAPIIDYVFEVVRGEMSEAVQTREKKLSSWKSESERKEDFEGVKI